MDLESARAAIEKGAKDESVSREEHVTKALENYIFLKEFGRLRKRFKEESDRVYTEEEIFEMVS